ncbi:hypothetical protein KSP40_PGU020464 [Platanthera guangdongensis]|uniref:Uncharacterized protein n=1 Tax=Platanthera guangdongensis TaxID=2320717 RepID=A0ABR2LPR4_9ASPA
MKIDFVPKIKQAKLLQQLVGVVHVDFCVHPTWMEQNLRNHLAIRIDLERIAVRGTQQPGKCPLSDKGMIVVACWRKSTWNGKCDIEFMQDSTETGQRILPAAPALPDFALALKPDDYQLPALDPAWNAVITTKENLREV